MSRVLILLLACLTACASYSQNHRVGLQSAGAASIFIGGIIALDGASCDESAGGMMECDEEDREVIAGATMIGLGLVLAGIGFLVEPKAAD